MRLNDLITMECSARNRNDSGTDYESAERKGIEFSLQEVKRSDIGCEYMASIKNTSATDFCGVIRFEISMNLEDPKFFLPGYFYNRNTADKPSSGRKAFPRMKKVPGAMPESSDWMTRADRLALPVSILYSKGHVAGIAAAPYRKNPESGSFLQYCGFTCSMREGDCASAGYTLGYENSPWLFVQTATVVDRKPIGEENAFVLEAGEEYSFELTIYDYDGTDERSIYLAIEDTYWRWHEAPRAIAGMDRQKALSLLKAAIRDYAWIEDENRYTGFVYDRPEGLAYNKIPSVSWTNGLSVAVPMLMAANLQDDAIARQQSLTFVEEVIRTGLNPSSGFLYESTTEEGIPTVRGWWYDGMHSGGHSSYLNGQAVYYILKAYLSEKTRKEELHEEWIAFAERLVGRMNEVINADYEYPFSMSEKTGVGLEYDSMGGVWFLAATAMYERITGDGSYIDLLRKSEAHYYTEFVQKVECYGGPLDTDKAVDSEGILGYIRAVRIMHEILGEEYLLDHLRDALSYEFTFKLCYNTVISVRPLSEIGWSSCGGSITSTANPHIHPMSSTVIDEMRYYCAKRKDAYVESRLSDTIAWGLQTFNTFDGEYGYGKVGWMSERFCFCEGLLTEKYADGEPASTWFALMPWAVASIIEGFAW